MFVSCITIIHSAMPPFQVMSRDCDTMSGMKRLSLLLLLMALFLSIVSCVPQTPIPVYVTPTLVLQPQLLARVPEASVIPIPSPADVPVPTATNTPVLPTATFTPVLPTATPLPYLEPSGMGIQLHTLLSQQDFNEVARLTEQLGLGWVKVQIDWKLLQSNGPGDTGEDFRRQELYLEDLKRRGHNVLASVARAPDWARSDHNESGPPDDPQVLGLIPEPDAGRVW